MLPVLLRLGSFRLNAYMAFLCLAFCVALVLVLRENGRRSPRLPISPLIGAWLFLGAMQGARIWHVAEQRGWSAWRDMLNPWEGGLAFHGGLVGGLLAGFAYALCVGAPFIAVCDFVLPYLALGEAITRVGCFLNGCCWGTVSNVPWAVAFPKGSHAFHSQVNPGLLSQSADASLPVHPTQLYMASLLVLVFFGLRYAYRKRPFTGFTTALFLGAHGVVRFVVEFVRGDSIRTAIGLTQPQLTALLMIALAIGLFAGFRHHAFGERRLPLGENEGKPLLGGSHSAMAESHTTED